MIASKDAPHLAVSALERVLEPELKPVLELQSKPVMEPELKPVLEFQSKPVLQ
jgi:hypothetical protein